MQWRWPTGVELLKDWAAPCIALPLVLAKDVVVFPFSMVKHGPFSGTFKTARRLAGHIAVGAVIPAVWSVGSSMYDRDYSKAVAVQSAVVARQVTNDWQHGWIHGAKALVNKFDDCATSYSCTPAPPSRAPAADNSSVYERVISYGYNYVVDKQQTVTATAAYGIAWGIWKGSDYLNKKFPHPRAEIIVPPTRDLASASAPARPTYSLNPVAVTGRFAPMQNIAA